MGYIEGGEFWGDGVWVRRLESIVRMFGAFF